MIHVYPTKYMTFAEQLEFIRVNEMKIFNEYGEDVSISSYVDTVTKRGSNRSDNLSSNFLRENYAEVGLNNLMRHNMTLDRYCVEHGEGTWSYIDCEFS